MPPFGTGFFAFARAGRRERRLTAEAVMMSDFR
jgi:hypothetical protein